MNERNFNYVKERLNMKKTLVLSALFVIAVSSVAAAPTSSGIGVQLSEAASEVGQIWGNFVDGLTQGAKFIVGGLIAISFSALSGVIGSREMVLPGLALGIFASVELQLIPEIVGGAIILMVIGLVWKTIAPGGGSGGNQ